MSKPVCIDLFCGLFGWGTAFAEAGYRVIGFDIENQFENFKKEMPAGCELILRDIRSITGADLVKTYGVPACIVGSPPCQEFSYMAMPWSKAKEKQRKIEASPAEQKRLCDLFNQCFRIQREVSAACGHHVPMVVENVRGAQQWVGKARWNFGSFYLWGDVPALMPIPGKVRKTPEGSWDQTRIAGYQAEGKKCGCPPVPAGKLFRETGQRISRMTTGHLEGYKQPGIGGLRENGKGDAWFQNGAARSGSKSNARKQASAEIAKIPPALAAWIAEIFKPQHENKTK